MPKLVPDIDGTVQVDHFAQWDNSGSIQVDHSVQWQDTLRQATNMAKADLQKWAADNADLLKTINETTLAAFAEKRKARQDEVATLENNLAYRQGTVREYRQGLKTEKQLLQELLEKYLALLALPFYVIVFWQKRKLLKHMADTIDAVRALEATIAIERQHIALAVPELAKARQELVGLWVRTPDTDIQELYTYLHEVCEGNADISVATITHMFCHTWLESTHVYQQTHNCKDFVYDTQGIQGIS